MKILVILLLPFFIIGCASSDIVGEDAITGDFSFTATIVNEGRFGLSILTEDRYIPANSRSSIILPVQQNPLLEGYAVRYHINIAGDVYKTVELPERVIITPAQEVVVIEDIRFTVAERYFTISNASNAAVQVVYRDRFVSALDPDAVSRGNRFQIAPGETMVYNAVGQYYSIHFQGQRIAIPLGEERSFISRFTFDGNAVSLIDARPLHRIGEAGWAKTIPDASGPMALAADGERIHLFVPTDRGIARTTYDSAGNAEAPVRKGGDFGITSARRAGYGFLLAGYEALASRDLRPIARIHGEDGTVRSVLEPSTRRDSRSAFFSAAAPRDAASWFLAGGSGESFYAGHLAYVALVRNDGARLTALWELAGTDFSAHAPGVSFGPIQAAAYDPARGVLLVTGEILPGGSSFVAEISSDGIIQNIDTSFSGLSFNRIMIGTGGSRYFSGNEQRGNSRYAFLAKYDANGRQLWRLVNQPHSHSYYQDAFLDSANGRIILAGTMRAREAHGRGGTPFIDAVSMEDGVLLWREELSDPSLGGAALVTAIAPAPDYGFALALSGVSDWFERPYIIARVNSQGKLIKELR